MLAGQERKGDEDYAAAEKKAAKRSWFGGTGNKEDAAELFQSAGKNYKVAHKFERAAQSFIKSAEMHRILSNKLDECNCFVEAGNCYKQANNAAEAIKALTMAAEMCMDANRLSAAAKHWRDIGEIHEKEYDFELAIRALNQAADFFKLDNQNSNATQCLLKVAAHSAQHCNNYATGIKIFETVGKEAVQNNLLKYSAKKYFFHAGLCRLASEANLQDSQATIESYRDYDVTFHKQREYNFLIGACESIANGDADDFTRKITDFDSISQLDAWTTSICLRIKKAISTTNVPDLNNDLGDSGPMGMQASSAAANQDDDDELC